MASDFSLSGQCASLAREGAEAPHQGRVVLATAPDSWGVWFPDDPRQPPWERFLDEAAAAGYSWVELGPFGYMPIEARSLRIALGERNLQLSAGGAMFPLESADALAAERPSIEALCGLLAELEAEYLLLIDDVYTDLISGEGTAAATLGQDGWSRLIESVVEVAEIARAHGLKLVFHPHADTHVESEEQIERFLADTPMTVGLCLDLGHHAYAGEDPITFFRRHAARIPYLHIKSVDPVVLARVVRDGLPFGRAVSLGVFVEPALGAIDFAAFRLAVEEVGFGGFAVVEQDMYPAPFDKPLPIARRTRMQLAEVGLG